MLIQLDSEQLIWCAHVTGMIDAVKKMQVRANVLNNRRFSNKGDFELHYISKLAEVAAAQVVGGKARSDITEFGDGGVDLEVGDQKIQVKCSTYSQLSGPRMLILNGLHEFKDANWVISCSAASPCTIEIHGFISREDFERLMFKKDFKYGVRLCVLASDLTPIEFFKETIDAC